MSKDKALDIVLSEFLELAKVPRPSHHEEHVSEYLFQWAKSHGMAVEKDNMNEIIIDKPASPGCENVPRVIFQAHMDMVCVCEEGVTYDPMNDPIKVINDGVTLTADDTSLGADDGIGVAMCLYLLQDDTLRHGPIRAIFTTNEEDGMDSIAIDPKYLDGGYLVNLDWETLGSLCNSCAGGDFFNYSHKAEWEKPIVGCKTLTISLSGLLGGHSGVGINKGHANALVSIATLLAMLRQGGVSYRVASFSGGQAKNAIPAFGTATIVLSATEEDRAKAIIETFRAEFVEAFGNIESDIIELFFARSEQGIRELDTKYGKDFHNLSYHIVGSRQDAEECVNDAYLGAWNAIPPARPNPLLTYICKIVRNISLKIYYRKEAAKRSSHYAIAMEEIEACIAAPNIVEAEIEARELARIIGEFLDTLTLENRVIFMRR